MLAAGLGVGVYGLLAYGHTHGQVSVIDEGLYLVKGLLYVRGVYWPFQDFGPLTNHMPLSFLIPGLVQALAGPGLAAGRAFALVTGGLMLLGLWLATRRLAGAWWAAAAVWTVALNAGLIKIYSQAISEGLIACMLVWSVALGVGPDRRIWHTTLAAGLAAVMGLTRINMLPVVILLVAYIYWAHGRSAGHLALATGGGVLFVGQALFLPGILKLWAKWLPAGPTPFLNAFRATGGGRDAWQVELVFGSKLGILVDSLRLHFASTIGVLWAWLAWPGRSRDDDARQHFKALAFLSGLFLVLFALHTWASLGLTYCPFCLKNYLAFFSPLGLIIAAMAGAHWLPVVSQRRRGAGLLLLAAAAWAFGLSLGHRLSEQLMDWQLPRFSGGHLLPGTAPTGAMIQGRFGLSLDSSLVAADSLQAVGVAVVLLIILGSAARAAARRGGPGLATAANRGLAVVAAITIGSATFAFGSGYHGYDCGADVVAAEQAAGTYLKGLIPSGAHIYWSGDQSPVPLLYLDRPSLYPPQLNGIYTYRYGGDAASLVRNGYWNQALAEDWLASADYVLVSQDAYTGWIARQLTPLAYDQAAPSPPTNPCDPGSALMLFRRTATQANP